MVQYVLEGMFVRIIPLKKNIEVFRASLIKEALEEQRSV